MAGRRQFGAMAVAEGEMLQIEREIDREAFAARPSVIAAAAQRYVIVAVVVNQPHQQSLAPDFTMGYGRGGKNENPPF